MRSFFQQYRPPNSAVDNTAAVEGMIGGPGNPSASVPPGIYQIGRTIAIDKDFVMNGAGQAETIFRWRYNGPRDRAVAENRGEAMFRVNSPGGAFFHPVDYIERTGRNIVRTDGLRKPSRLLLTLDASPATLTLRVRQKFQGPNTQPTPGPGWYFLCSPITMQTFIPTTVEYKKANDEPVKNELVLIATATLISTVGDFREYDLTVVAPPAPAWSSGGPYTFTNAPADRPGLSYTVAENAYVVAVSDLMRSNVEFRDFGVFGLQSSGEDNQRRPTRAVASASDLVNILGLQRGTFERLRLEGFEVQGFQVVGCRNLLFRRVTFDKCLPSVGSRYGVNIKYSRGVMLEDITALQVRKAVVPGGAAFDIRVLNEYSPMLGFGSIFTNAGPFASIIDVGHGTGAARIVYENLFTPFSPYDVANPGSRYGNRAIRLINCRGSDFNAYCNLDDCLLIGGRFADEFVFPAPADTPAGFGQFALHNYYPENYSLVYQNNPPQGWTPPAYWDGYVRSLTLEGVTVRGFQFGGVIKTVQATQTDSRHRFGVITLRGSTVVENVYPLHPSLSAVALLSTVLPSGQGTSGLTIANIGAARPTLQVRQGAGGPEAVLRLGASSPMNGLIALSCNGANFVGGTVAAIRTAAGSQGTLTGSGNARTSPNGVDNQGSWSGTVSF